MRSKNIHASGFPKKLLKQPATDCVIVISILRKVLISFWLDVAVDTVILIYLGIKK